MGMTKYFKVCCLFFLLLVLPACSSSKYSNVTLNHNPNYSEKSLLVHYIDVGQGDSILIQINNRNLLIDAGPKNASDKLISYLDRYGVKKLDFIVSTHPHEDHIGSMEPVVKRFQVGSFYAPKVTSNTKTFENMVNALKSKKLKINVAKEGIKLDLGENVDCTIIAPVSSKYDEINHYSAVLKLTYGNNSFLFMGDAEKINERELLSKKSDLKADVLKIGHHGSTSSSSKEFLDAVSPNTAVISCGADNDYGHPHKETVTELRNRKITLYRTDTEKDILLISDGNKINKK